MCVSEALIRWNQVNERTHLVHWQISPKGPGQGGRERRGGRERGREGKKEEVRERRREGEKEGGRGKSASYASRFGYLTSFSTFSIPVLCDCICAVDAVSALVSSLGMFTFSLHSL